MVTNQTFPLCHGVGYNFIFGVLHVPQNSQNFQWKKMAVSQKKKTIINRLQPRALSRQLFLLDLSPNTHAINL